MKDRPSKREICLEIVSLSDCFLSVAEIQAIGRDKYNVELSGSDVSLNTPVFLRAIAAANGKALSTAKQLIKECRGNPNLAKNLLNVVGRKRAS